VGKLCSGPAILKTDRFEKRIDVWLTGSPNKPGQWNVFARANSDNRRVRPLSSIQLIGFTDSSALRRNIFDNTRAKTTPGKEGEKKKRKQSFHNTRIMILGQRRPAGDCCALAEGPHSERGRVRFARCLDRNGALRMSKKLSV